MDYVNFKEILFSLFASAVFGFLASLFYVILHSFIYSVERFILLPKRILVCSKSIAMLKSVKFTDRAVSARAEKLKQFAGDFLYVLFYGIGAILLLYLVCDGALRLYPLMVSLMISFFSVKLFSRRLERLIALVPNAICLSLTVVTSILLMIARRIVLIIIKACRPLYFLSAFLWRKIPKK